MSRDCPRVTLHFFKINCLLIQSLNAVLIKSNVITTELRINQHSICQVKLSVLKIQGLVSQVLLL